MTDEEIADMALSLSEMQAKVILVCARGTSIGYRRMAEKIGATYKEVQQAGRCLQSKKLAYISTVRLMDEYNGSALFLNEKGEKVRHAVEIRERLKANR